MSAAEVMAPVDAAPAEEVPVAMEATIDPVAVAADEEDEEELVFKARGKRTRHQADAKGGADVEDDVSPRGPIDASQADSPPKSSDDELEDDDDAKLPGKKKLKLRKKSAAAAENAAFGYTEGDSELDEDDAPEAAAEGEGDFYYDEDDEEGQLEMRMREKGTLSEDEEVEEPPAEEESEESDLEDPEDELDLDDAPRPAPSAPVAPAPVPENETEEEKEARMAREKAETAAAQQEIMREASRRARLSGYHVAPDRDPFAYRKIFATLATIVEKLNLPPPPPDPVEEQEPNPFDGEDAPEDDVDEEEAEYDSQAEDEDEEDEREPAAATVELEMDPEDEEGLDDQEDLGLENDEIAAMMAAVEAKKAAVAAATDAKELRAQKKKEKKIAAEEAAAAAAEQEDDLSEEETHEMTRKERLRQLKKAKAFFKADAAAQKKAGAGEAFEDEAEMSEDGGHTSDEEEVEVEEAGENTDRVIKRRVAKRADGLLDREELEEMVDYIDFNDTADDDERRMAKRAAAHARFEEERDEEEVRKMHEALKNGFRRPNKNGLMGEDGPDYWQRRRKNVGEDESDEEDDLGIDIPDRAWEAVVLSSDDDGEWAERAARRKAAAAAAEAAKKASAESAPDGFGEESQVPSARDVGFASQDFKSMIDAGKQRRRRVQRGVAAAAAAADAGVGFAAPAAPLPRANSGPTVPATGGSRLNPVVGPRGLERQASTSFLGRAANGSKSSGGLVRSVSLGGGGASRSFVFGGGGDSQSMWEKDAEENGRETPPTVLKELGADDNARTDFGWAPRDKFPASKQAPSRLGGGAGGSGQSLFGMLQASQDWEEVIGRSDSLAEGVKAAKNIKLRPAAPR